MNDREYAKQFAQNPRKDHSWRADGNWYSCFYCGAGAGSPRGKEQCTKNFDENPA